MIKDSTIRLANLWWKSAKNIEQDDKIKEWENSTIKHDPRLRHKIKYNFAQNNTVFYTLRGPRQVGKTTLIKLQIRDFLKAGINPWNIFYYSCELVNSKSELVEVIESYLRLSKRHRKKTRSYLFLDEISSVNDWPRGIKWLIENKKFENSTVLATSSHAIDILNQTERLPGRKGRSTDPFDKILIPMKFVEFVSIHDKELEKFISNNQLLSFTHRAKKFSQLVAKEIPKDVEELYDNYLDDLNNYLYEYLLTGGIPKIVDEKIKTNFIDADLYSEYLVGIQGDWKKFKKKEMLLKQFGGAIIGSYGSSTNWDKLRQQAQLGSWATAQEYAITLNDLLITTIIQRFGEKKKIPLIPKEKKIYFHDPFYFHIFNTWLGTKDPFQLAEDYLSKETNQSHMVEGVIADHLIRWAFSLAENKHGFDYTNQVLFWKDDKGKEVDFVLYQADKFEVPIEVKYRNKVDVRELGGLSSFLDETDVKSGLVLSKNELDERQDYLLIPTSVFLMFM